MTIADGTYQDWIAQLEDLKRDPPDNIPEARLDEFRQHIQKAIDAVTEAVKTEPQMKRLGLSSLLKLAVMENVLSRIERARVCGVNELRAPRGPAEITQSLIDTPPSEPHNKEQWYPVKQR